MKALCAALLLLGGCASTGPHATRDEFARIAAEAGLPFKQTPGICEWTRPSLASWREEKNCVAIPNWNETSEKTRALFDDLAPGEGRRFFELLFRWFLIPHELTHAIQTLYPRPLSHALAERVANDIAVAFHMRSEEGRRKLRELEPYVRAAEAKLPIAVPAGESIESYFERNYHELTREPRRYGAFQFAFIRISLDSAERINLIRTLQGLAPRPR